MFLSPIFSEQIYSMLAALAVVSALAIVWNYIDVKNIILREKSSLVPAFIILLFSSHTAFFVMSPYLVASLFFLWGIEMLFAAYHSHRGAVACVNISFVIAVGSLFQPLLLLYFPLFLFGFSRVQIISFKGILAVLLGFSTAYIPMCLIGLFADTEGSLFSQPEIFTVESLMKLPILSFNYGEWFFVGLAVVILAWLCVHNYLNSYKDKIRTRVFIFFLGLIQLVSAVFLLFLNYGIQMNIYVGLTVGAMLLAHYFTLTSQRIMVPLFVVLLIGCFIICYASFV